MAECEIKINFATSVATIVVSNMKSRIPYFLTSILSVSIAFCASAIPAKRGVMSVEQPDGTCVQVKLVGDERAHQYFTADDYLLVNRDGYFYYATVGDDGMPESSGIRADGDRSAEAQSFLVAIDRDAVKAALQSGLEASAPGRYRVNGLFPDTRFPAMGAQRSIVILVEYKDVSMTLDDAHDYFYRMLNETGFSDYGGTGSAKEYFEFNSNGNFICDFDVYGPVTLSQNRSYYGGNNYSGDDRHPEMMVVEACQALDDEVDFSEYDRDGDGYVDNVFIFYAGRGEASGGSSDTVWPHSWTLASAGVSTSDRTFDNVTVDRYACSNEYESGRPDGVGTFIHEFSHVLGLPDLYATSYTSAFTPGEWSALDYGPYNNNGCTPPNYGAFERAALGWMEPIRIQSAMNATLPPIDENIAGIIYNDSDPDEYFLFENRQQTGWDKYIPGHGMLVWHVDYSSSVWNNDVVNNTSSHQYCDIEEADNTKSEYSRDGDSFPGASNVTSFTDDTTPNMKTWGGSGFGLPLTEITEVNGIISFKVAGGVDDFAAPDLAIAGHDYESLTVTWTPRESCDLMARVAPGASTNSDTISYVNCGSTGTYTFSGLESETEYVISGYLRNGLQSSDEVSVAGTTGRPDLSGLAVLALDATDVAEDSFTACWEQLPEATDYTLTVYERTYGAPMSDSCDFTGYDSGEELPEGWTSTSKSTYANTAYSGNAIPALRMGNSGDKIETPDYGDDIRAISFWHRANASASDYIAVYLKDTDGTWQQYDKVSVVNEQGGIVSTFEDIPTGYTAVRLQYVRTGSKGTVALDDIEIQHGATYSNEELADYDGISTGNTDNMTITGLKPETTYCYDLTATDGTLVSKRSNMVTVVTKVSSGIEDIRSLAVTVSGVDGAVVVSGAAAGSVAVLTDLSGRVVAKGKTDDTGEVTLAVAVPGFYIVQIDSAAHKVGVR